MARHPTRTRPSTPRSAKSSTCTLPPAPPPCGVRSPAACSAPSSPSPSTGCCIMATTRAPLPPHPPAWIPDLEDAVLTNVGRVLETQGKELIGSTYKDPITSFPELDKFSNDNPEAY